METKIKNQTPPLYGLVLAGGKSTRMGQDKHLLDYHGQPQAEYLYGILQAFCEQTFMSVRADQISGQNNGYREIVDQNIYRGPFNGLLSAHARYPEAAWLVLACDLPLIDEQTIAELIRTREPKTDGTAMATRKTGLPEPLAARWEPSGLSGAVEYLKTAESSCPRKYLIRSEAALVIPEDDKVLANANDPETYNTIRAELSSQ